jgi:hypothetical protein
MGRACGTQRGEEKCIHGWAGKPEMKGRLHKAKYRWEDNIKIDLKEIEWGCGLDTSG